ncbi:hypothetical protein H5410_000436 [Solanum commersonii]|uniref:Uncharacterized protein n=1 Tax=Solanum commersonii TaxID=4109 RepID=A0A9J6AX75_SOLCO|nr:hypothetical protein H5410_000436 [Solanum commersonii]
MWSDSTNPHVEPPVVKFMPGRPRKVRNKECWETKKSGKLPRTCVYMTCSICHGKNHNKRSCPLKDSVTAGPSNEAGTSRAIPKPRGRPRKTPTTTTTTKAHVADGEPPRPKRRPRKTPTITTEAPVTDGEPPRPKGRPRKTNVNPDAPPPKPRGRPRKTTNNEALIATLTIGRGITIESLHFQIFFYKLIFTPVATSKRDITADTTPTRGRCIGIGRVDTTPARERGINIERADTTPARGRGIGIGRGRGKNNTTVQAPGRDRGFKVPLSGLPSNRILHTGFGQPISSANVTGDLGFKPKTGVRWKGKKTMTSNQLEVMRDEMRMNKSQKRASSQS